MTPVTGILLCALAVLVLTAAVPWLADRAARRVSEFEREGRRDVLQPSRCRR